MTKLASLLALILATSLAWPILAVAAAVYFGVLGVSRLWQGARPIGAS